MHEIIYGSDAKLTTAAQAAPLTVALKEAVSANISTARRAYSVLYDLRTRLLGFPPPSPVAAGNTKDSEPSSFADAMSDANSELAKQLHALETLAEEVAGRL